MLEGLDRPLDHRMEKFNLPDVDKAFTNFSNSVKELETIRTSVIDKFDEVLEATGACAYNKPNTYKAGTSLLWKLSADNQGNIATAQVESIDSEPFIAIRGKASSEGLAAGNKFITYCNDIIVLPDKLNKVAEDIEQQAKLLAVNNDNYTKEISDSLASTPMSM
jgi:hypothetical protein